MFPYYNGVSLFIQASSKHNIYVCGHFYPFVLQILCYSSLGHASRLVSFVRHEVTHVFLLVFTELRFWLILLEPDTNNGWAEYFPLFLLAISLRLSMQKFRICVCAHILFQVMLSHSNLAIITFSLNSYLEIICILLTFKPDAFLHSF